MKTRFLSPLIALLALVQALDAAPGAAQSEEQEVSALPQIRVQARQVDWRRRIAGHGYVRDSGTLIFVRDGGTDSVAIPLADVRRLEIARGARSQTGQGAVVGLVGGAALGAAWGAWLGDESVLGSGYAALFGAMTTSVAGAGIGAIVGHGRRVPRWERVDAAELRVAFAPRDGGFGVGLALRF